MALAKFAFVGLCVFLCLSFTSANSNGASSRSINGDGDDDDYDDNFPTFANTNRVPSKSITGAGEDDGVRFPKKSFANPNKASSNSINVVNDDPRSRKIMPFGTGKHPLSGSAHLRGKGFGFGFGFDCSVSGACQNPNGPVAVVEYPCPGYVSICDPSPCYPTQPSYGCQTCNQAQTNMAQNVNMKNGAQSSPNTATQTMPRVPNKQ